ncbi:preATP grasp domain-containing protein [Yoonia sediminilitoris]|uniref:Pre ATP-grasp domain-containing protein n=1 Tax=Yoonia sediminilitoris TaxID=1286148 RepID=A0A2T6KC22_9RHOB|nr:hypothetical protein [Yoonia sediminilitoris]PUB12444.1 hypothetical protein C8N45_11083 [Yoonia sediminilitoris]RCW93138.1 hypothetical protein DFP92_11083 [Yoonia sediminilitoris]
MSNDNTLTNQLLADEPAFLSSLDFGPHVTQGTGAGPSLLIGDMSQISLMQPPGSSYLDYRMAHLAKPGDIVLVGRRDPEFDSYLAQVRGLDDITILAPDPLDGGPIATKAMEKDLLQQAITDITRKHGGLTVKSYLTTGTIWRLAQQIGAATGCTINVSGPAPRISERANDKLWFTRLARTIIGASAVPPTMPAYGPDAAAAVALKLGKSGEQVVVKVPDSAGSAGNIRLDSTLMAQQTIQSLETLLLDRLHATGWADRFPILVGVWDRHVTHSPSVQMWLPHTTDGRPISLGVFEQAVMGQAGAFIGAVRSTLPKAMQDELVAQATRIAAVLQRLGYYGNCSLDAVIYKDESGTRHIHWIECNGRWTGVSIPLITLDNITRGKRPEGIVVVQQTLQGRVIGTTRAVEALDDMLARPGSDAAPANGVVLMSPPSGARSMVINLLVFAESQSAADEMAQRAITLLRTHSTG